MSHDNYLDSDLKTAGDKLAVELFNAGDSDALCHQMEELLEQMVELSTTERPVEMTEMIDRRRAIKRLARPKLEAVIEATGGFCGTLVCIAFEYRKATGGGDVTLGGALNV